MFCFCASSGEEHRLTAARDVHLASPLCSVPLHSRVRLHYLYNHLLRKYNIDCPPVEKHCLQSSEGRVITWQERERESLGCHQPERRGFEGSPNIPRL